MAAHVVFVGPQNAGKTRLLYALKGAADTATLPTIGFNMERLVLGGREATVWDAGGADKLRPLWRHYLSKAHVLVFVVDATLGRASAEESAGQLSELLNGPDANTETIRSVLVVANKTDLPGASVDDVAAVFSALPLRWPVTCVHSSATKVDDLRASLAALVADAPATADDADDADAPLPAATRLAQQRFTEMLQARMSHPTTTAIAASREAARGALRWGPPSRLPLSARRDALRRRVAASLPAVAPPPASPASEVDVSVCVGERVERAASAEPPLRVSVVAHPVSSGESGVLGSMLGIGSSRDGSANGIAVDADSPRPEAAPSLGAAVQSAFDVLEEKILSATARRLEGPHVRLCATSSAPSDEPLDPFARTLFGLIESLADVTPTALRSLRHIFDFADLDVAAGASLAELLESPEPTATSLLRGATVRVRGSWTGGLTFLRMWKAIEAWATHGTAKRRLRKIAKALPFVACRSIVRRATVRVSLRDPIDVAALVANAFEDVHVTRALASDIDASDALLLFRSTAVSEAAVRVTSHALAASSTHRTLSALLAGIRTEVPPLGTIYDALRELSPTPHTVTYVGIVAFVMAKVQGLRGLASLPTADDTAVITQATSMLCKATAAFDVGHATPNFSQSEGDVEVLPSFDALWSREKPYFTACGVKIDPDHLPFALCTNLHRSTERLFMVDGAQSDAAVRLVNEWVHPSQRVPTPLPHDAGRHCAFRYVDAEGVWSRVILLEGPAILSLVIACHGAILFRGDHAAAVVDAVEAAKAVWQDLEQTHPLITPPPPPPKIVVVGPPRGWTAPPPVVVVEEASDVTAEAVFAMGALPCAP